MEKCMEYNDLTKELEVPKCPSPELQLRTVIMDLLSHLVAMVPCLRQTEAYNLFEMQLAQQDTSMRQAVCTPLRIVEHH
jgi:hypothetical protein